MKRTDSEPLEKARVEEELSHESPDGAGPPRKVARISKAALGAAIALVVIGIFVIGWRFGWQAGLVAAVLAVGMILVAQWPGLIGGALRQKERQEARERVGHR